MRIKALMAGFATTAATVVAALAPATASATTCVEAPVYWPTSGQVTTSTSGNQRSLRLDFSLTQDQINSLACRGGYAEAVFVSQDAGITGSQGAQYTLSTNVPGGVKQIPFASSNVFAPGATGITVSGLQAGQAYFVAVNWTGGNATPTFTADWVRAHYATSIVEKQYCNQGRAQGTTAWCYWQTGTGRHSLTGGYVPLNNSTYPVQ